MDMEFEFKGVFYLDANEFEKMVSLCKEENLSPQEAVDKVSRYFDDQDYYIFDYVNDQIVEAVKQRLNS